MSLLLFEFEEQQRLIRPGKLEAPQYVWLERSTEGTNLGLTVANRTTAPRALLGTGGAALNPDFHLGHCVLAAERREGAAIAGIPAPGHEFIVGDVFEELLQPAATGLFRVLKLATEFGRRTSDENHPVFRRRQTQFGISGRHVVASQIAGLVAGFAAHGSDAVAILAAFYVLQVDVAVIALERSVASGMAILAARRSENFMHFQKRSGGSGGIGLCISGRGAQIGDRDYDQNDCQKGECRRPDQHKISTRFL
jgi:hypothetical protein